VSNRIDAPTLTEQITELGGTAGVAAQPALDLYHGRDVPLGGSTVVRRLLPNLGRRLVGAWCFVDHYGPDDISGTAGMQVAPHPHIGLQTVSWLLSGEVHHMDSIGSDQLVGAGHLGVMTSGRGIAHSEQSPAAHPGELHGVQLWVALPDAVRNTEPAWQFASDLPVLDLAGGKGTLFMGEVDGAKSLGTSYSPIVGVDLQLLPNGRTTLPLESDFEYGLLVMDGAVEIESATVTVGDFLYLGTGRRDLELGTPHGTAARAMLLGGEPFGEEIVMWWNFVARDSDEIVLAREQWARGDGRFGGAHAVAGYHDGPVTAAPPMPAGRLKPSGSARERKTRA
jgi:redox-sensitive bicupin YhaK (pirin superfamily)